MNEDVRGQGRSSSSDVIEEATVQGRSMLIYLNDMLGVKVKLWE